MCILLLTTAHPSYALVLLDNRDEFILRPTSRPAWYSLHTPSGSGPASASASASAPLLSSRDLQRAEKGTWLGLSRTGHLAVLTNYREADPTSTTHPIRAIRSRGGMVTYWLGTDPREDTRESLGRLVREGGVKGVGGFSMLCGKLRRKKRAGAGAGSGDGDEDEDEDGIEPVAIVSNRSEGAEEVSWVAGRRGEVCALSNAFYGDADEWPKVEAGRRLLADAVRESVGAGEGEAGLAERLFGVLDTDTLPRHPGVGLQEYVGHLKDSIFIPPVGDARQRREMEEHAGRGAGAGWPRADEEAAEAAEGAAATTAADGSMGFETGMYGTQRQTVVLVDWDGNVVFIERALFDGNGNPIARGEADDVIRFKIEGWEDEER